ncbi:Broad specificity phosphatase PhoE [Microlunatus soli]|uniref:phosphoglycerate mutase (2,3-diphosphoglycerate-dependent) n=2 Tax=Microlunatus soli TaxID=630515 RepID=A0A1H1VM79_9ACTN|nr:Broad specificity phosphatase PhoE [Microlunatus soli]
MPNDLVLVRHGEAEGNVVREQARQGDESGYTERFVTTPGRRWQLTADGREQARCAGAWIRTVFDGFDRYYASPFTRTTQTATWLALSRPADDRQGEDRRPRWYLNRSLRERDWGDVGSIPRKEFTDRPEYALNARRQRTDPLYWVPPGGESIAQVAENRVRNFLDTLHRELAGRRVLAVTHGEFIWATRLVLERLDDDEFVRLTDDDGQRIGNCEIVHYTRRDPGSGAISDRLEWLRRSRPIGDHRTGWRMQVDDWQRIEYRLYLGDTLADADTDPECS